MKKSTVEAANKQASAI